MVGHHSFNHKKMKRRCQFEKCRKLGKDILSDGTILCRIHSPMREAFKNNLKAQLKKEKKNVN